MLLQATEAVTLFAMAVSLWMAFYLFARGFPSRMSMRVVVMMLALAGFFFGAYNNIFIQIEGSAAIRAVLLVIVLAGWYSVTFHVMSDRDQRRFRRFDRSDDPQHSRCQLLYNSGAKCCRTYRNGEPRQ